MSYNESLRPNSNYPPMSQSDWDRAPWNQSEPPEENFNVTVSYSLSKDAEVISDNYYDDGRGLDTLDNPSEDYEETYQTMPQILDFAKECAKYFLTKRNYKLRSKYDLKNILDSCEGWTVDEFNVEQI